MGKLKEYALSADDWRMIRELLHLAQVTLSTRADEHERQHPGAVVVEQLRARASDAADYIEVFNS